MDKTIEILTPHKKQLDFITSIAKFRAFIGSIGSGKSYIGCAEMIMHCINNPKSLNMIIAPSYRLLEDATKRAFFTLCDESLIADYRKGDQIVVFTNGSELLFRNAQDPDIRRGPTLSAFFIDEAALVTHETWQIMLGRLRQSPFPLRAWVASSNNL